MEPRVWKKMQTDGEQEDAQGEENIPCGVTQLHSAVISAVCTIPVFADFSWRGII